MFTFHEGLPGHGKTWEAVVYHILPAIKKERAVFTNIRGMNHEKIAELSGLSVDRVKELLFQLEWEDTPKINTLVQNDSLVVIDELQDFWPVKGQVSQDITEFVTQHRHRGLDIVAMGQDLRDCNAIWKRRVENKVRFVKQSALGRDNHYSWTMFKAKGPEKFEKINSGTRKYDSAYFGCYKTKRDDANNLEHYRDDRANVFKNRSMLAVPLAVVAAVCGLYFLYGFFHKPPVSVAKSSVHSGVVIPSVQVPVAPQVAVLRPVGAAVVASSPAVAVASAPAVKTDAGMSYLPEEYPKQMFEKYRPRLAAFIEGYKQGQHSFVARIELLDDSFHAKEEFTVPQLAAMGWDVAPTERGVFVTRRKDGLRYLVTAWPIDPFGRTSDYAVRDLGPKKEG